MAISSGPNGRQKWTHLVDTVRASLLSLQDALGDGSKDSERRFTGDWRRGDRTMQQWKI